MDNIYALASGQGRAGVAVVRLSGDGVFTILKRLIKTSMPAPRLASLRSLYNPDTHDLLDKALVIIFQAPHSYSGENMVELHVHGGRAVLNALFSVLQKMPDIRLSEAGEFTRRAFLNNRLNLTEAEGVMDLINAESDAARRLALQQANGGLTDIYQKWMQSLKESAAFMEACIDFSDEELPENTWKEALITVKKLQCDIQQHLTMGHQAERVRSGVTAVILGPPNAGKSSLLNWFAGRDVAIVSTIAGTTRDSIEVFLEIDGLPFVLIDTAGLNPDSVDEIESIGITRAYQHGKKADIRLFLYDVATLSDRPDRPDLFNADTDICIFNKGDKLPERPAFIRDDDIYISVLNDDMDDLMRVVNEKIHYLTDFQEMPALTQARHRDHLQNANENLKAAMQSPLPELAAEELRHALHSLGCITGQVNIEEILDVVFSQFCIGK